MDLENIDAWAKIKGIKVLAIPDFTHPIWFKELKKKLEPASEAGLFKIKQDQGARFILVTEISCIYSKGGRVRKVHVLIFAPSIKVVEKISKKLSTIGNLSADGRPILGLDAKELLKIALDASPDCLIVPAHVMTPWFGMFGSKSGFDSIEECFDEYSKYIYALETGLSADPAMIWKIPAGKKMTLISNSDAHSLPNMGREANVFDTELSYSGIVDAIKTRDNNKFLYTTEFYPQEGKYHYDGHRACDLSLSPEQSKKYKNICPRCGKSLTLGVLNRIQELSEKGEGKMPEGAIPFKSLVPLREIIAEALDVTKTTKKVEAVYNGLISKLGGELGILLDIDLEKIKQAALPRIAEGIKRVREGNLIIEPGYDGVYGKVRIFSKAERKDISDQGTLF
jgi:uncharacterized protein (TIGR00375 family)